MSIQVNGTTTVRELVGQFPQTRKVFEEFGIDYCCGGGKCLTEAAQANQVELSALLVAIEKVFATPAAAPGIAERAWYTAPLHELVDHILHVHHAYMKEALPRVRELVRKVLHAHGAHHGEMLQRVCDIYSISHPIQQMEHEHEIAGQALVQIRKVTGDYHLPHVPRTLRRTEANGGRLAPAYPPRKQYFVSAGDRG